MVAGLAPREGKQAMRQGGGALGAAQRVGDPACMFAAPLPNARAARCVVSKFPKTIINKLLKVVRDAPAQLAHSLQAVRTRAALGSRAGRAAPPSVPLCRA